VPELEMKHLVADVELERLAATRIQEFRLRSRQAQRDTRSSSKSERQRTAPT
jgi:hypothetical protein